MGLFSSRSDVRSVDDLTDCLEEIKIKASSISSEKGFG